MSRPLRCKVGVGDIGMQKHVGKMWAKDPIVRVNASVVAIKVATTRVPTMRAVESRYTLQGGNKDREKHQMANGGRRKVDEMMKETRQHIIGGDRELGKESLNQLDKAGWMEEDDRAPLNSKAETVFTVECSEDLRVWGVPEVWNKEVGKQKTRGE